LTPHFQYIPKATLAAVIISAVIFMIEYEVVTPMWRSSSELYALNVYNPRNNNFFCLEKDLVPTVTTFTVCLAWGVEFGILAGVAVNVTMLLYPSARPTIQVEKRLVIHNLCLIFRTWRN
jgi:solute carrier family 26 (sodium-independent sulfate anion transporter), member 11